MPRVCDQKLEKVPDRISCNILEKDLESKKVSIVGANLPSHGQKEWSKFEVGERSG